VTAPRKKGASCGIELDTWKAKVERFVSPRLVVTDIRQITECDPRRQFAVFAFEVELVPNHFAECKRLRMIGAGDADRARHRGPARHENGRQENHGSHPMNLGRDAQSSSFRREHPFQNLFQEFRPLLKADPAMASSDDDDSQG
jgi:hypothetical protein